MDEDDVWDGYRMVDQETGQIAYRVRGRRVCDANTNATVYRIRDNVGVVDANSNQLVFRIQEDGRVVDAYTKEFAWPECWVDLTAAPTITHDYAPLDA